MPIPTTLADAGVEPTGCGERDILRQAADVGNLRQAAAGHEGSDRWRDGLAGTAKQRALEDDRLTRFEWHRRGRHQLALVPIEAVAARSDHAQEMPAACEQPVR